MIQTILLQLHSFVFAAGATANCGDGSKDCDTGLPQVDATGSQLHDILQIAFGVIAALAVLMIVISGLRFITAQGNPQEISKARNTIVYALVGLVVAVLADAIVTQLFVNL